MAKAKSHHKPKAYRVRESTRAKHVSIRVSHLGEVEVVIPKGFDRRQIPAILERRKDWIAKTTQRIAAERQIIAPDRGLGQTEHPLPSKLELRSIAETWSIDYDQAHDSSLLIHSNGVDRLTIAASSEHPQMGYRILRQWLMRQAEIHLPPWLQEVSEEVKLPFNQTTIRGQKTIWASCSGKKNISLNYKLLFLPPALVHYVFIHELCHTIHLNHSSAFWSLVAEKQPNYKIYDTELNKAWRYIPEWVERPID